MSLKIINAGGVRMWHQNFHDWWVSSFAGRRNRIDFWNCLCKCGAEKAVSGGKLRSGESKRCMLCASKEKRATKHGMFGTPTYNSWAAMIRRCYNEKDISYKYYGALDITVCDRWRYSFVNFFADMGVRPSREYTLHRLKNSLVYGPGFCEWADWKTQNNLLNKRNPWEAVV